MVRMLREKLNVTGCRGFQRLNSDQFVIFIKREGGERRSTPVIMVKQSSGGLPHTSDSSRLFFAPKRRRLCRDDGFKAVAKLAEIEMANGGGKSVVGQ